MLAAREAIADASVADAATATKTSSDLGDEVRGLKRTISLAEKQCQISIDQRMVDTRDKHAVAMTSLNGKLVEVGLYKLNPVDP